MAKIVKMDDGRVLYSGRIGDTVFYISYGRQMMRRYAKPTNVNSPAQRKHRIKFSQAVKAWKNLSKEERERYKERANSLKITPNGLFISEYLENTP